MAEFFIRRPIVAIVISIITVVLGLFTLSGLSIEQYPFLAPPTIRVTANYTGASAIAVEQSVATPVEQEVNGVENMIYMKSSNTSDGRMQLDVNFEVGVDQDMSNVLTQNRVSAAQAKLPQEVVAQGVTVKKMSPSILMLVSLYSPNGTYDANFLINYCGINLRDQLLRIPGVAQVDLFGGTDYSMRIWLRPDKMATLGLTPSDVIAAVKEQNLQAPAGRVGMAPSPKDQEFTYTVSAPGRLVKIDVFIFLQNLRATIIPLLTVPVSLIGTFIFFPLLGFSVNTLSMFGLILAIGIVVDDAIVVVEAVMHHIEHGMTPHDATVQAMKEVSAPVIGIALILSSVFIPVAFVGGLTGRMYQQFALTIAISVLLSAFSALSLSPALCVLLLRPSKGPMRGPLGAFFRGFNRVFDRATGGYVHVSRLLVRRSVMTIVIVGVVVVGAGLFGRALATGFIPEEDQ